MSMIDGLRNVLGINQDPEADSYVDDNEEDDIFPGGGQGGSPAPEEAYPTQETAKQHSNKVVNINATTQLQVVAAIRHVTTGTYLNWINSELQKECKPEDQDIKATLQFMSQQLAAAVETVTGQDSTEYVDFHARRLVEMAGYTVMGLLLLDDTTRNDAFRRSLRVFVKYGQAEVAKHADFISNFRPDQLADYMQK